MCIRDSIRANERLLHFRHRWVLRLRTDLRETPALPTIKQLKHLDARAVWLTGVWHNYHNDQDVQQCVARDHCFLVPRTHAEAVFSVGLAFLHAQRSELNDAAQLCACGTSHFIGHPECVLTTHLKLCDIPVRVLANDGEWSTQQRSGEPLAQRLAGIGRIRLGVTPAAAVTRRLRQTSCTLIGRPELMPTDASRRLVAAGLLACTS